MNANDLKLLISPERIQARVQEIAHRISYDYKYKDLVLIGILKGSFIFTADLTRSIGIEHQVDFIGISSYKGDSSTGLIKFTKEPDIGLKDKDVVLVEDIVDTGLTINEAVLAIKKAKPSSIKICTLIDKQERRKQKVQIDYACFIMDSGFIVGYGLDYNERYRHLPGIFYEERIGK